MAKRMLIDASHPEETRVVVLSSNRLEEFDYESATRKQLKGNIYLAKITRVEPSLQAAFVEYGGNRHGFLPFSEIHPDYYRIPIADREALIAEEARFTRDSGGDDGDDKPESEAAGPDENEPVEAEQDAALAGAYGDGETEDDDAVQVSDEDSGDEDSGDEDADGARPHDGIREVQSESQVDTVGGDDVEDAARRRARLLRRYKIQEVIKRRQVILVQVAKEERGNKGAALTTYLSLAGRYCVLMPNTARGGGISRKIGNASDRRRLKKVISDLDIPEGVAVIVRTAGSERSKVEIRRDYEYLMRLWSEIRETTLQSTAPALVYEEANLIKRALRDLYSRDMDDILVEGDAGQKVAKAFMKNLTPSHARKIKLYKDDAVPLFHRYKVEGRLDSMHNPSVQLKSGGYIVINPTEALVAIDVNSGRATRERHIEETALKTNIEAAEEVARQLRLRDLAGLIVIDFIDMEEPRHNRDVERRFKDAMRHDRARIQFGRISPFGLLEMSRQRLRPSLFESSTVPCDRCAGTGHLRSTESAALHLLRSLEEEGLRKGGGDLKVAVPTVVALHVLNQKRGRVIEIEQRYGLSVRVEEDNDLVPPDYTLERLSTTGPALAPDLVEAAEDSTAEDEGRRRKGRRRRRRKDGGAEPAAEPLAAAPGAPAPAVTDDETAEVRTADSAEEVAEDEDEPRRSRRRRGKRGGRRRSKRRDETVEARDSEEADREEMPGGVSEPAEGVEAELVTLAEPDTEVHLEPVAEMVDQDGGEPSAEEPVPQEPAPQEPRPRRRRSARKPAKEAQAEDQPAAEVETSEPPQTAEEEAKPTAKPKRRRTKSEGGTARAKSSDAKPRARRRKKAAVEAPEASAEPTSGTSFEPASEPPVHSPPEAAPDSAPEPSYRELAAAPAPGNGEGPVDREPSPNPVPQVAEQLPQSAAEESPDRPKRRGWWQRWN